MRRAWIMALLMCVVFSVSVLGGYLVLLANMDYFSVEETYAGWRAEQARVDDYLEKWRTGWDAQLAAQREEYTRIEGE